MATILIVEDECIIADDIQSILVRLGHVVPRTVVSGADAIRAAGELRPDLVLMDIKLRGEMDGIEAARVIQERFAISVVYMTSHSDEATMMRAMATASAGYLIKPFEDDELGRTVARALQRRAAQVSGGNS